MAYKPTIRIPSDFGLAGLFGLLFGFDGFGGDVLFFSGGAFNQRWDSPTNINLLGSSSCDLQGREQQL